ncbi:MAG TPA: hypothetical protein VLS88_18450 [Polyangiales bacterium]|nr:hypothetical protein [Polyangiales bacterium]
MVDRYWTKRALAEATHVAPFALGAVLWIAAIGCDPERYVDCTQNTECAYLDDGVCIVGECDDSQGSCEEGYARNGTPCSGENGASGTCQSGACEADGTGGTGGAGGGAGGTGGSGGSSCAEPPAGSVIIEDQDFADADWVLTVSQTTGATVSTDPTGQQTSGGVENSAYRSMVHEITNPNVGEDPGCTMDSCSYTLQVTHRYQSGSYTPASDGPIDYIDYSESRIITEPAFEGAGVGWRFAIWQGGVRYILDSASNTAFTDIVWTNESNCGLRPEDFTPEGLNFVDGSELTFGYIRSNTNTSLAGSTQRSVHGIDDFRVVIVKAN